MSYVRKLTLLALMVCTAGFFSVGAFADSASDDLKAGSDLNGFLIGYSSSQSLSKYTRKKKRRRHRGGRFVEFRGEYAYFPGNTVIRYGFLDRNGKPVRYKATSFQAAGGVVGYIFGSIIPVPSKVGLYSWDNVTKRTTTYRVRINARQYRRLERFIKKTKRDKQLFHMYSNNCVRFARDAARAVGLKAPQGTAVLPPNYVNMLRRMNGG